MLSARFECVLPLAQQFVDLFAKVGYLGFEMLNSVCVGLLHLPASRLGEDIESAAHSALPASVSLALMIATRVQA